MKRDQPKPSTSSRDPSELRSPPSLPAEILANYDVYEWRHATAILRTDFPNEYHDIIQVLLNFRLRRSEILAPGGQKSKVATSLDSAFYAKQPPWIEKDFSTQIVVDGNSTDSPTHSVDCYRNHVAVEIEWNNKDPFFDRDLNNFRLLFDLRVVSVGVIITRSDELQSLFGELGRGKSYGASTTHLSKLLPRMRGGGGGGCPVMALAMKRALYLEDQGEL